MDDIADFSSRAHMNFITSTLAWFDRDPADCEFFTADNCSVNTATASMANVPLIGCASHRLALATREVIKQGGFQDIVNEVALLMEKLTTLKNADKLRNCVATNGLLSIIRNATRWTSDHKMLERFVLLYPHLFTLNLARDTTILIPNSEGFEQCQELLKILKDFYDATISLQKESIDMHDIRCIFDVLQRLYPASAKYLAVDAKIVKYPDFENGIVKLQSFREDELTPAEKGQLKDFKIDHSSRDAIEDLTQEDNELTDCHSSRTPRQESPRSSTALIVPPAKPMYHYQYK